MADVSNLVTISCENHHDILFRGLWNLFLNKQKVDCDMQFDGRTVRVHRLLLDVFLSPDSQQLQADPSANPASTDPDSNCLDLMVEFMYSGRVTVRQDQLKVLLKLARDCKFHMLVGAVQTVQKRLEDEQFELKRAQKFRRFDPAFLKPTSKFQQGGVPELASDVDDSNSSSDGLPEASDEMLVAFKSQLSSRLERLVTYSKNCQDTLEGDSLPNGTAVPPEVKPVICGQQSALIVEETMVVDDTSDQPVAPIKAEHELMSGIQLGRALVVRIKPEPMDENDSDIMAEITSAANETVVPSHQPCLVESDMSKGNVEPNDSQLIATTDLNTNSNLAEPELNNFIDLQVKKIKLEATNVKQGVIGGGVLGEQQTESAAGDHGDCSCVMCDPCRTNLGPWEPEPPKEPLLVPAEELDPRKLRRRFRIHMARHPFECGECHMHFNQRYQLIEHASSHSNPTANK